MKNYEPREREPNKQVPETGQVHISIKWTIATAAYKTKHINDKEK